MINVLLITLFYIISPVYLIYSLADLKPESDHFSADGTFNNQFRSKRDIVGGHEIHAVIM